MQKGDIVLVRFPFTDLSSTKLRPALVLSSPTRHGDVILAFITTQRNLREPNDVLLTPESIGFSDTGLKSASAIVLSKLATLNSRIVLGKIGHLPPALLTEVNQKLSAVLGL